MTPVVESAPWKPRTRAAAITEPRYGSSPEPSTMRPHRGSRAMSTMGANVQWRPFAAPSAAATRAARSTAAGSQLAASASGVGKIVRNPWITSCANSSGIFARDCSMATRCRFRVTSAPEVPRNDPMRPALMSAVLASGSCGPVTAALSTFCVSWPSFSSSVRPTSTESTKCSMRPADGGRGGRRATLDGWLATSEAPVPARVQAPATSASATALARMLEEVTRRSCSTMVGLTRWSAHSHTSRGVPTWLPVWLPSRSLHRNNSISMPVLLSSVVVRTTLLLICSNVFMTFALYAHLRNLSGRPWYVAAIVSWGIALFEYLLQVPGNRIGYTQLSLAQLKILQEVITLGVFVPFAVFYMRQPLKWDYAWAGLCIVGAVSFMFRSG